MGSLIPACERQVCLCQAKTNLSFTRWNQRTLNFLMTVPAGKPSLNTILDSCAASTENNDMWDDSKTIPSLGKGTTRLKHREKKYRKSAIFYGAMNSVIDASLFVNVTMKAFFADVVIFAIV